ncbi:DNA methyltransferase [Robertmurraya massiliosenegalensis]|uniref:site-specific DNA-methyltransferase n=1 Tax=Robertmurraya TaxID=2837507 RepID=UPI0039A484CB
MIKETLDNNEHGKLNDKKVSILKQHFPNCFTGGKFDLEKFKKEVNQDLDFSNEGYELNFLGKNYAKYIADSIDTETVVSPNVKHNSKEMNEHSGNIYVTGDNLDVLKHLRKSYSNKIKMIYIDPPYNTGGDDFVYRDNFEFTREDLMEVLDVESEEAERIINMTSSNSSSHSAWLTFMYPRLYIARELLTEDGIIFISNDDNEQAQLKILCDDIFGEENFITQIVWKNKYGAGAKTTGFIEVHEYITCYTKKSITNITSELSESEEKKYTRKDSKFNERGGYRTQPLATRSLGDRPNLVYPIYYKDQEIWPNKQWVWSKERMENAIKEDLVEFVEKDGKFSVYSKTYIYDENGNKRRGKPLSLMDGPYNQEATADIRQLFEDKTVFNFSKPEKLVRNLISMDLNDKNDKDFYVLDFFSGSGTTAHAVMKQNAEDKGNRKYIMVNIDEPIKKGSEADKSGFKTIDEIGRERIIRAAKLIKAETNADIDYGFKHYYVKSLSRDTIDNIKEFNPNLPIDDLIVEFDKNTILTTWMNKDGHSLNPKAEEIKLDDYIGYLTNNYLYLVDKGFNQKHIDILLSRIIEDRDFNPSNIIIYGYNFNEYHVLEQLELNLKQLRNEEKNIEVSLIKRY